MTALETLAGVGPGLAAELRAAGVRDVETLHALGAAEAARRVAELGFRDPAALRRLLTDMLGEAATPTAITVLGIDNVLFAVGDLDAALAHYAERLGLPVVFRLPDPPTALLRLGAGSAGLVLREHPGQARRVPGPDTPRVWLEVPDATAAATRLGGAGVEALTEPFAVATGTAVEFADAWGNVVGLTDHTAAPDRARPAP